MTKIKLSFILTIFCVSLLFSGTGNKSLVIKQSLPLWQKYLDKSKNIKDGAAFIPLAMRMVITQLGVTDRADLYNLDIQIHLALKDMAFYRGLTEGTKEFRTVINLTARKGDRISMTIHPKRKTVDLHVKGVIINFDVFDIYLKTLDLKKFIKSENEEEFNITAVIGEENLIVEKNFKHKDEVLPSEPMDLDSVVYQNLKLHENILDLNFAGKIYKQQNNKNIIRPIYHYELFFYDFSGALYYSDKDFEGDIYFTSTTSIDGKKSYFYRYLLGAIKQNLFPQIEFGFSQKEIDYIFRGTTNFGYNVKLKKPFFGFYGALFLDNYGFSLESEFFGDEAEIYDKNDINLIPRFDVSLIYNLADVAMITAGGFSKREDLGWQFNLSSKELYLFDFLKYAFDTDNSVFNFSSINLDLSGENLFKNNKDDLKLKIGLIYNFRYGQKSTDFDDYYIRKNKAAF